MACRSKRGGLNRSTPTRPKQSAQEKAATTSFTASAYWKFESSPLQRRVEQTLRGAHRHRAGLAPGWDEITKGAGKGSRMIMKTSLRHRLRVSPTIRAGSLFY